MLGHQGFLRIANPGFVEVAVGYRAVFQRLRREQVIRVSMRGYEALQDSPQNLRPHFADGVHAPVARFV